MIPKHTELFDLASKFHDDCLDRDELARLNVLLQNEEARREFVDFARVEYCLKAGVLSEDYQCLANSIGAVHRSIVPDSRPSKSTQPAACRPAMSRNVLRGGLNSLKSRRFLPATLAASAILVVSLAAIIQRSSSERAAAPQAVTPDVLRSDHVPLVAAAAAEAERTGELPADFVARIVAATNGVIWAQKGAPSDFLLRLYAGERIKITAGLLKVEFVGGAVIILSGPADLEVISSSSARLFAGSLTGQCEGGEFTLQTSKAEVIDVGTEFGVSVDRLSDTKVAVFDGEVHVKSSSGEPARVSLLRLTTGMSVRIDQQGLMKSGPVVEELDFRRELPTENPTNLGIGELSLIDVICGSGVGEYRIAGAIDPLTGHWGKRPWTQSKGVELRSGVGRLVDVDWNTMVNGVFVPSATEGECTVDSEGNEIHLPNSSGTTWGPVWARRRSNIDLDPFAHRLGHDDEGFWGAGTITAMLERLRWARDGLVGLHANIGITVDLDSVRRARPGSACRLRGIVTLLERSHVSQPFHPKSLADFRVFIDGQERYQRLAFTREDGDSQFGATIEDKDRYLTLVVTDSGDGNMFDRVILIDPVIEFESSSN